MSKALTCTNKSVKRIMTMVMVIILMVCISVPAFAQFRSVWVNFPYQTVSGYSSKTYLIQAIMWRYSAGTWGKLTNGGNVSNPVDAVYGNYTKSAVEVFQLNEGITVDGKVGSQSWGYLWDTLGTGISGGEYLYFRVTDGIHTSYAVSRRTVVSSSGYVTYGWYGYDQDFIRCYAGT